MSDKEAAECVMSENWRLNYMNKEAQLLDAEKEIESLENTVEKLGDDYLELVKTANEALAENERLRGVEMAARMFVMHTPIGHIPGLIERNYYEALQAALKERND